MIIDGFELIGKVRRIEIIKREGCHSICRAEILVTNNAYELFIIGKAGTMVTIEDEERIWMCGIIRDITGSITYLETILTVTVISSSYRADEKTANRIFQSPDKTYRQVAQVLSTKEVTIQILDKELSDRTEAQVLIQDDETDFGFINRLAKENDYYVFVDDTNRSGSLISITKSMPGYEKIIWSREIKSSEFSVRENEVLLKIRLVKPLDLGETVRVRGFAYVITGLQVIEENNVKSYYYELRRQLKQDSENLKRESRLHIGKAVVVSNDDPDRLGRLQVEFRDIEDCVTGERLWISYLGNLTEKDGGVLWFPDKDEWVQVICRNGRCMAVGCVRQTAIDMDFQTASDRILKLRDKKVLINPDKIEVEAFGQKIQLEKLRITLENEKFSVKIEDDLLSVNCGNTRINLNEEAIQLLAASRIDVKAGRINMDGNEKISVKTGSFDIG